MNKVTRILGTITLAAMLSTGIVACSKVPAGNVGIKVYLLGTSKGVDTEELGVGMYWVGWNEELYLFPTFTQNYTWMQENSNDESISFQTIEGLSVNADVGISYHIDPHKVNLIFQKYRRGIEEITDTFLRNMVRDALVTEASDRTVEDVYGQGKAELMIAVENRVKDQVREIGIEIERIYWIGDIRLPDNVVGALNAKIQANQMAAQRQNEVAQSRAEAQKKVEEARGDAESIKLRAEAQAAANKILANSLTNELVQYKMVEKWDGVLPRLTGSGAVPFLNVDQISGGVREVTPGN